MTKTVQGSHKPRKPGIVGEFCKPGKVMEKSGNLRYGQGIFYDVTLFATCCPIGSQLLQLLLPQNVTCGVQPSNLFSARFVRSNICTSHSAPVVESSAKCLEIV